MVNLPYSRKEVNDLVEFYTMESFEHMSDALEALQNEAASYGATVDEYLAFIDDFNSAGEKLWD